MSCLVFLIPGSRAPAFAPARTHTDQLAFLNLQSSSQLVSPQPPLFWLHAQQSNSFPIRFKKIESAQGFVKVKYCFPLEAFGGVSGSESEKEEEGEEGIFCRTAAFMRGKNHSNTYFKDHFLAWAEVQQ